MKYSFWGFGMIMLGLFGLVFLVMFESITINNESEYYVLKEAMEASMLESVDFACYRIGTDSENPDDGCGDDDVKIAASISGDVSQYKLQFYDIIEKPPKATVVISGKTQEYVLSTKGNGNSFELVNDLNGILELRH